MNTAREFNDQVQADIDRLREMINAEMQRQTHLLSICMGLSFRELADRYHIGHFPGTPQRMQHIAMINNATGGTAFEVWAEINDGTIQVKCNPPVITENGSEYSNTTTTE